MYLSILRRILSKSVEEETGFEAECYLLLVNKLDCNYKFNYYNRSMIISFLSRVYYYFFLVIGLFFFLGLLEELLYSAYV